VILVCLDYTDADCWKCLMWSWLAKFMISISCNFVAKEEIFFIAVTKTSFSQNNEGLAEHFLHNFIISYFLGTSVSDCCVCFKITLWNSVFTFWNSIFTFQWKFVTILALFYYMCLEHISTVQSEIRHWAINRFLYGNKFCIFLFKCIFCVFWNLFCY